MSTLSSTSTLAEIQAAYDNNASWFEDASTTKARAFATACRMLIRRMARRASTGGGTGEMVEMDLGLLRDEMNAAVEWLSANDSSRSGPSVRCVSLEDFRS